MQRPVHRGFSGSQIPEASYEEFNSQIHTEDFDKGHSPDQNPYLSMKYPVRLILSDMSSPSKIGYSRNGFASEPLSTIMSKNRHKLAISVLRMSLVLILVLALSSSLWWSINISSPSRGSIAHGYRRLQEQLVTDLLDIGEISLGSAKFKELSFCPEEYENRVPCFNSSENLALGFAEGVEYERHCGQGLKDNCLVLPPANYKIPLRWPTGRDVIWAANVKISAQEVLSSRSMTKRMMMEEDQISFRSASLMLDSVEDYSHQIAEMLGLRNESGLIQAGVRTILDVGCGYGSFGAHLYSKGLLTMCIAPYEASGSQVQLTLERGLPAMVGSLFTKQLPFPSLSYEMLHCSRCGFDWDVKDGLLLLEMDRVLRPGGYFVWTSPLTKAQTLLRNKENQKKWNFIRTFAETICWKLESQQDETVIWKKTSNKKCYTARRPGDGPATCSKDSDLHSPYYQPLQSCIGGFKSRRWIPIEQRLTWPSRAHLNSTELSVHGVHSEDIAEDNGKWNLALRNYWSLLSPLLFSDHPKRPGDEDPSPPYNMLRNVLDMNARFGGFNSALLDAGKSVWVMNVVPTTARNYLPLILDRGFIGALHDWCEAFPTYPRTYDLVHAEGLLSLQSAQHKCTVLDMFTEIDRILRPEGWVILRDAVSLIESSRALTTELKWDARIVEIESNNEEKLLICQKPFIKRL